MVQGKTPWVDQACADRPGFPVLGAGGAPPPKLHPEFRAREIGTIWPFGVPSSSGGNFLGRGVVVCEVSEPKKRQNTHHPQCYTSDVDRRFCGGGALISRYDSIPQLRNNGEHCSCNHSMYLPYRHFTETCLLR